ncbi:MAG TPA: GAF and ANTAR domain-containing protein [Streptosporangiaceae bacterium]|jgi:putative methionine-R-sulfoxide reductase with GAF domain
MSLSSGTGQTGSRPELSPSPTGPPPDDSGQLGQPPAPEDAVDLIASIAELQRLLVATEGVEDFLQGLASLAAGLLSEGLSCGVAVEADGKPVTAACSDEVASQIDEVQYLLGEGPCLTALRDQKVVSVEDTAETADWPGFAPQAAAYGIRSCLSVPLRSKQRVMGALNLYSPVPGAFREPEVQRAEEFAGHASAALAVATRLAAYTSLVEQLRASLVSRAVIDQALGVIMGQKRCTQAEAFDVLRTASQQRNIKLRELAREIVTEVSGQPPQPPPVAGA